MFSIRRGIYSNVPPTVSQHFVGIAEDCMLLCLQTEGCSSFNLESPVLGGDAGLCDIMSATGNLNHGDFNRSEIIDTQWSYISMNIH